MLGHPCQILIILLPLFKQVHWLATSDCGSQGLNQLTWDLLRKFKWKPWYVHTYSKDFKIPNFMILRVLKKLLYHLVHSPWRSLLGKPKCNFELKNTFPSGCWSPQWLCSVEFSMQCLLQEVCTTKWSGYAFSETCSIHEFHTGPNVY